MNLSNKDPLKLTRGKRSLAAIAFTDAVGYSEWANRDESAALSALEADHAVIRDLCEEFGGRVLKSTGDGLMMRFDSAVDAVECAIAIQGAFAARKGRGVSSPGFEHRIGIHLGDVLVTEDDILGDGVNIAARLQQVAQPCGICLSQTVYDVVKGRIVPLHLRPLGAQLLKNIAEPVVAYAVSHEPVVQARRRPKQAASSERNLQKTMTIVVGLLIVVVVSQAVLFRFVFSRPDQVAGAPLDDPRIGWVLPSSRLTELLYLPEAVAAASRLGVLEPAPKVEVDSKEAGKPVATDIRSAAAPPTLSSPPITVSEGETGEVQGPSSGASGASAGVEVARREHFKTYDFEKFAKWVASDAERRAQPETVPMLSTSLQLSELHRWMERELSSHGPEGPLQLGLGSKTNTVFWDGECLVYLKEGEQAKRELGELKPQEFHDLARALARETSRRGDAMRTERWLQIFRREFGLDGRGHEARSGGSDKERPEPDAS